MTFSNTLNYRISDLSALHRTKLEKQLAVTGIHSGQIFILFELWNQDGLSQIELAANLKLSSPTINRMVKKLEAQGYVSLKRSVKDSRIVNVFLNEKSISIKPEVERIWTELESELSSPLTETEKLIFSQLLDKVLSYLYEKN